MNERQIYLDSFSYLIDLTYDYAKKNKETFNKDAKKYYFGCISEMNQIYELCKEKLFGIELSNLEKEQQQWQDAVSRRLIKDLYRSGQAYSIEELDRWELYFQHGDLYLRRAFHLVNLYYECEFYN